MFPSTSLTRVGLIGLGAVGKPIAKRISDGFHSYTLNAVCVNRTNRAKEYLSSIKCDPFPSIYNSDTLYDNVYDECDIIIECAPPTIFDTIMESLILSGKYENKIFIPVSSGGLISYYSQIFDNNENTNILKQCNNRILIPSGAVLGIDGIGSHFMSNTLKSVVIKTTKNPKSLPKEYEHSSNDKKCIFNGSVAEAIKLFPANVNVSVIISMAGIGIEKTKIEIWSDNNIERNTHEIVMESECGANTIIVQGIPSEDNKSTGKITPYSVINILHKIASNVVVGS
eukprot:115270_1